MKTKSTTKIHYSEILTKANQILELKQNKQHLEENRIFPGKDLGIDFAWNHCYSFFKTNKSLLLSSSLYSGNKLIQEASTELCCYLAFFGMFTKPKWKFQTNREIFYPVIINTWNHLAVAKIYDFDQINNEIIIEDLRSCILTSLKNVLDELELKCKKNISDKLITKILLGMFGCTPAYDKYFTKGLKRFNSLSNHSFKFKYSFHSNTPIWLQFMQDEEVKEFLIEKRVEYYKKRCKENYQEIPLNRIADLFFFQLGYCKVFDNSQTSQNVVK